MTQHYPLHWPEGWPRTKPENRRRTDPFKMNADRVRRLLFQELRLLGAADVIVSSNVPTRNDGTPYADAARRIIRDPGVAVWFSLNGQQRVMARDGYEKPEANLRSIGLAIEHMRGLERHGGAAMMERAFAGFEALPGPETRTPWHAVLQVPRTATRAEIDRAYRNLARARHPDTGGSEHQMAELNRARDEALKDARA